MHNLHDFLQDLARFQRHWYQWHWSFRPHSLTCLLFCAIWVGGPFLYQDPLLLLSCPSSSSLSFHYCPLFGPRCHQCPSTQRQLACEMISEAQGCSQDYSYRRSQLFQSDGERDGERLSHTLDLVTLVG